MKITAALATLSMVVAQDDDFFGALDLGGIIDNLAANIDYGVADDGSVEESTEVAADTFDLDFDARGPTGNLGMTCTKCEAFGANAETDCKNTHVVEECGDNRGSCEAVFHRRDGVVTYLRLGCKDRIACQDNQAQNFVGDRLRDHQCKPWATAAGRWSTGPNTCTQCCNNFNGCWVFEPATNRVGLDKFNNGFPDQFLDSMTQTQWEFDYSPDM